jgi:hypothetical protein
MMGEVYLICFDRPFRHARHYLGWSQMLRQRLWHHRNGTGARLLAAVNAAGIGYRIVRVWKGSRTLERLLKQKKSSPRLCPVCRCRVK